MDKDPVEGGLLIILMFSVYILASMSGTLYTGITNDIRRRLAEHRAKISEKGFTARYGCKRLVYVESFPDPMRAIMREKQIKRWSRKKKERLIRMKNTHWRDMAIDWILPEAHPYED